MNAKTNSTTTAFLAANGVSLHRNGRKWEIRVMDVVKETARNLRDAQSVGVAYATGWMSR